MGRKKKCKHDETTLLYVDLSNKLTIKGHYLHSGLTNAILQCNHCGYEWDCLVAGYVLDKEIIDDTKAM